MKMGDFDYAPHISEDAKLLRAGMDRIAESNDRIAEAILYTHEVRPFGTRADVPQGAQPFDCGKI